MPKPTGYYYMPCGDSECPECGNDLTDKESLVVHTTHRKSFRTKVGKDGTNFEGYVMDPKAADCSLVMRDPEPTFQCGGCFTNIRVESIEES